MFSLLASMRSRLAWMSGSPLPRTLLAKNTTAKILTQMTKGEDGDAEDSSEVVSISKLR